MKRATQAPQDLKAKQVARDLKAAQDLLALPQQFQGLLAQLEVRESRGQLAKRGLKATQVRPGQQGARAILDLRDQLVIKEIPETKA